MSRPRMLLVLVVAALAQAHPALAQKQSLCSNEYCECNPAAHPSWLLINCTVPGDKKLDIVEGDVPNITTDINITGAEAVMFGPNSLSQLSDARYLQVIGTKLILFRKFASVNLNIISLFLEIQDCELFRIEEKAFTNLKGPLSVTITNCDTVSIESEAFSWLLSLTIKNVAELRLSPSTFVLDPTASNIGLHGPGLLIDMINVTIPEFTSQTFGSSAAAIILKDSAVEHIRPDAFTANTYNRFAAFNTSFGHIHRDAFAQKSLIHTLILDHCKIKKLETGALQSAIATMNITFTKFNNIESGAVNVTVANINIADSKFVNFAERGFTLAAWNKIYMRRNTFDELPPNAIIAPGATVYELIFAENEIEKMSDNSLGFIGKTRRIGASNVVYEKNYYGQSCHCNISRWLAVAFDSDSGTPFQTQSLCTVDEFFARCFNVPEQNMVVAKFLANVCHPDTSIKCEPFKTKTEGGSTEIKNPRFPHKKEYEGLSDRNKKVIGIVIVTALGCILIAMLISLIRWMNRKGYCTIVKNFLLSSQSCCGNLCNRIFSCGNNHRGVDNAGSISQLSVHEYSERHRLNETRIDMFQETAIPNVYEEDVLLEDKMTQTLPEVLTKELLENLRDRLDDPDNYKEAREMIEHLYELIKVEESCHFNTPIHKYPEENIYEMPIISTMPRMGKNKKPVISVGTTSPSLDKLTPLSPYNRTTALMHDYFEPKDLEDMAAHLYSEINGNSDKEFEGSKRPVAATVPDVAAHARGPYLKAMRDKTSSSPNSSEFPSPTGRNISSGPSSTYSSSPSRFINPASPDHLSTIQSNKSVTSNGSGRMSNRPLPEKPVTFDPGEGPSKMR